MCCFFPSERVMLRKLLLTLARDCISLGVMGCSISCYAYMWQDQFLVPINPISSGMGEWILGWGGWSIRRPDNDSSSHKITPWNIIHQPRALRRQGGETYAWDKRVSACFPATSKHRLLPCLTALPRKPGLLQLWGETVVPRQRQGRSNSKLQKFLFYFILRAELCCLLSQPPSPAH